MASSILWGGIRSDNPLSCNDLLNRPGNLGRVLTIVYKDMPSSSPLKGISLPWDAFGFQSSPYDPQIVANSNSLLETKLGINVQSPIEMLAPVLVDDKKIFPPRPFSYYSFNAEPQGQFFKGFGPPPLGLGGFYGGATFKTIDQ